MFYPGHLYVAGGGGETRGPWFRDLWRLNLEKLDAWQSLPPYPINENLTGPWLCFNLKVYKDKAYVFTGRPEVDFFDLSTQTWGSITTTYKRTQADIAEGVPHWPYPLYHSRGSTQEVVGSKLYVFGGKHGLSPIGSNLFMELDFETRKWCRLSGTVLPKADFLSPNLRTTASSWVDRDQERIYIIFGESDRSAAKEKDPNYAEHGFANEDFWSWDIKNKKWRMERLSGNAPCPRSEAACVYVSCLLSIIIHLQIFLRLESDSR